MIQVSAPIEMSAVDIPDSVLSCPPILKGLQLPVPDANGLYSPSDIDELIAYIFNAGSQCERNLNATRKIYLDGVHALNSGEAN